MSHLSMFPLIAHHSGGISATESHYVMHVGSGIKSMDFAV
jgi:hypothetical protein